MNNGANGAALPHNLDAEASILGGIILRNETLQDVPDLEVDHFYDLRHKTVFQAVLALDCDGRPIDTVTLEAEIEKAGKLESLGGEYGAAGGIAYLGELALRVPTPENVRAYADIVIGRARARRVALRLDELVQLARTGHEDLPGLVARADITIDELRDTQLDKEADSKPASYGAPFRAFIGDEPSDNPADVFEAGGLIVRGEPSLFIGDPKVGKTFLLQDLALHLAAGRKEWCGVPIHRRCRVLLFLREDSVLTTRRRLHQLLRGARIEAWELDSYLTVDATSPLYFDDLKLVAKLERQLRDVDVCAIDSLSTIHNADENSVERMAPIMNRWRDLALGTNTAIPLVHHFRKGGGDATGVGVLQRARGSSIIGATTRHAVGVERGPGEHQVVVSVESNHETDVEPFVIRRRFTTDDQGRRSIAHERVGSLQDARGAQEAALLDPLVLQVVREGSAAGIGGRALRQRVVVLVTEKRGKGVRPAKVDAAALRLASAGKIVRIEGDKWRLAA